MRSIVREIVVAAALTLASFAAPASAQVATYDNPRHIFVSTMQLSGEQTTIKIEPIYDVPDGRGLRVTDLVLSNWGIGSCAVLLPGRTAEIIVPVDETISVNFLSGPTYMAGEQLSIANTDRLSGHGPGCNLIYTIGGYLFKKA